MLISTSVRINTELEFGLQISEIFQLVDLNYIVSLKIVLNYWFIHITFLTIYNCFKKPVTRNRSFFNCS